MEELKKYEEFYNNLNTALNIKNKEKFEEDFFKFLEGMKTGIDLEEKRGEFFRMLISHVSLDKLDKNLKEFNLI